MSQDTPRLLPSANELMRFARKEHESKKKDSDRLQRELSEDPRIMSIIAEGLTSNMDALAKCESRIDVLSVLCSTFTGGLYLGLRLAEERLKPPHCRTRRKPVREG